MGWEETLNEYVAEVRRSARLREAPVAPRDALEVTRERAFWRRAAATHLLRRLPVGSVADAAFGGLQDSAPRSGLLSLHARVEAITPDDWEHPDLAQIWLRWADYIVPRTDLGAFTLGTLPRDPRRRDAVEGLADMVVAAVADGPRPSRDLRSRLGLSNPHLIRSTASTGRVVIRWDARTVHVMAASRPDGDAHDARNELLRRFLHWYGPVVPGQFAKWAGVTGDDAETTRLGIREDLAEVAVDGRQRWMLREDIPGLLQAEPPEGTRLLPPGDPALYLGNDLPAGPGRREVDDSSGVTRRLVNGLTGRILSAGRIVGAWGRAGAGVTLDAWQRLSRADRAQVEDAAAALASPIGRPIAIRWLPPRI